MKKLSLLLVLMTPSACIGPQIIMPEQKSQQCEVMPMDLEPLKHDVRVYKSRALRAEKKLRALQDRIEVLENSK